MHTKELADAKAENDALRDDAAAGRRRLHISSLSVSVKPPPPPAWDNAASPDWQTPPNGIISPSESWSLCKNNWKEPRSILMSSADRVAHIDGQLMQLLWAIHTRFQRRAMFVLIKPSNSAFTNVCWVSVLTFSAPPHKFWLHRQFSSAQFQKRRNDGWWFPLVLLLPVCFEQ